MFSDVTIRKAIESGEIGITWPGKEGAGLPPERLQTVSIDLTLGGLLDLDTGATMLGPELKSNGVFAIYPGRFLLGSTFERVYLGGNVVGQIHGKSTLARMGLLIHAAGLVDPGFEGELTLEIFNLSPRAVRVWRGMPICQITFDHVSSTPERLYGHPGLGSRYQGQTGPTPARD